MSVTADGRIFLNGGGDGDPLDHFVPVTSFRRNRDVGSRRVRFGYLLTARLQPQFGGNGLGT